MTSYIRKIDTASGSVIVSCHDGAIKLLPSIKMKSRNKTPVNVDEFEAEFRFFIHRLIFHHNHSILPAKDRHHKPHQFPSYMGMEIEFKNSRYYPNPGIYNWFCQFFRREKKPIYGGNWVVLNNREDLLPDLIYNGVLYEFRCVQRTLAPAELYERLDTLAAETAQHAVKLNIEQFALVLPAHNYSVRGRILFPVQTNSSG